MAEWIRGGRPRPPSLLSATCLATSAGAEGPANRAASAFAARPAPSVFSEAADAAWGGRPSLGAVRIAHPETGSPRRVVIRDTRTRRRVESALHRRDGDLPGPPFQDSSGAAAAFGMRAGTARGHVVNRSRDRDPRHRTCGLFR